MKLTKAQTKKLQDKGWDVVSTKVNGKDQNCKWVEIYPEDGSAFGEVIKAFGLSGKNDFVSLLVVATSEED